MPTSEIARNSLLFVLVADVDPERIDYRELLPDARIQWGFVSKTDIFSAALRLQPWDVIIVDQSMLDAIPDELLAATDVKEDDQDILLLLEPEDLGVVASKGLLSSCGYLLRGETLKTSLARLMRRRLYFRSLDHERQHLEQEIARILEDWEQSIRDRTQKLEETNQQLKALDEMKTRFLANISHELRTPLTVIRSYIDLLIECPPQDAAEQKEFLGIIANETLRLSQMIDNLLDLARIDSGRVDWSFNDVDLRALLGEVLEPQRVELQRRKINVQSTLPQDLPLVYADHARLKQVFNNLLSKTFEHVGDAGEVWISAEMTGEQKKGDITEMIQVCIDDNGERLAPSELPRLFDRFATDEEQHSSHRGAGLSFAICKEIINHHGGRIWAEPSKLGGLQISLTIPVGHLRMITETFEPQNF